MSVPLSIKSKYPYKAKNFKWNRRYLFLSESAENKDTHRSYFLMFIIPYNEACR